MKQRTTLTVEADDLETLKLEARRRGVSLNSVLADLVAEKAAELQAATRPRFGLAASTDGTLSKESVEDEDSPASTPYRSQRQPERKR